MTKLEQFEHYRPLLFSIAYRMLGTVMEAEEMVQESFLRWQRTASDEVMNPKAYLSSIVTRLSIDYLRSARVQREEYIGPWLPEPLLHSHDSGINNEERATLADSISAAFLMLLETLSPVERAVFLLHDVFEYEYALIARLVGKNEANCRQIARRARKRIIAGRPRFEPSSQHHEQLTLQFLHTCANGDMQKMLQLLADDVVLYSDGGGKVVAARKPLHGSNKVARFLLGIYRKAPPNTTTQLTQLNAQPGVIVYIDGNPYVTFTFHIVKGRIQGIYTVSNPDKLQNVPPLG